MSAQSFAGAATAAAIAISQDRRSGPAYGSSGAGGYQHGSGPHR